MFQLKSKIAVKVLGYFFLNPHRAHYINELAEILDLDPGNLFRKLKELEEEGILFSEKRGNQKYYGLNNEYPLLREVEKSYNAKYGIPHLLGERINKLDGVKEAYIFGSYAQNNLGPEGDIDLLLVGSHSSLDAKRMILPLQKIIGREINIVDVSSKELELRKKKDDFIKNIYSRNLIKIH